MYIASIIVSLIFRRKYMEELKTISYIYTEEFMFNFMCFTPLVNTIGAVLIIKDSIREQITIWQARRLLKYLKNRVGNPQLKKDIQAVLDGTYKTDHDKIKEEFYHGITHEAPYSKLSEEGKEQLKEILKDVDGTENDKTKTSTGKKLDES